MNAARCIFESCSAPQQTWLKRLLRFVLAVVLSGSSVATSTLSAQEQGLDVEKLSPVRNLMVPGEAFEINGQRAFILWPDEQKRRQPQPWIMYAPAMPAYPDAHEEWMHRKFLEAGIAVAGIDMGEAYGSPQGTAGLSKLYDHLVSQRDFHPKPCLLGRSRGGLWVSSWAIANPEKVAGIIAIYPVFDLRTYPGLEKAAPSYGLSKDELESKLSELNPISKADTLANAKIPFAIIHGDIDTVVPLQENSQAMLEAYQTADAEHLMHLEVVVGQGHNFWEGFFRSQKLVDFGIEWAKGPQLPRLPE